MTLIDSLDSVVMLYSYAGFPERSFALFERPLPPSPPPQIETCTNRTGCAGAIEAPPRDVAGILQEADPEKGVGEKKKGGADVVIEDGNDSERAKRRTLRVKNNAMSNLSILLTIMSILVAFRCVVSCMRPTAIEELIRC